MLLSTILSRRCLESARHNLVLLHNIKAGSEVLVDKLTRLCSCRKKLPCHTTDH